VAVLLTHGSFLLLGLPFKPELVAQIYHLLVRFHCGAEDPA